MVGENNAEKEKKKSSKKEFNSDSLWTQRGIEDVYFQREAQVNFWSILGGIAVAALLTQIPDLIKEIKAGYWHYILYTITAFNVITNSWVQNLWGSLVVKVRVSMIQTYLYLLNFIGICIISLFITDPVIFFSVGAAFMLSAILIQVYIMKTDRWSTFTVERVRGIKIVIWLYLVLMVILICAAAQLYWLPSKTSEIIWGIFIFLSSIGFVVAQHFGMEQERKEMGIP
jgi:hypothetical protein